MKKTYIIWFLAIGGLAAMLYGCKKEGQGKPRYLEMLYDKNGYAIDDKKHSIQIIMDENNNSFSIMRNACVLFTFNGDFSQEGENFWRSAVSSRDTLRAGAIITDSSIDGIPDHIIFANPVIRKDPRFVGKMNLQTYVVDEKGTRVARVETKDGKVFVTDP